MQTDAITVDARKIVSNLTVSVRMKGFGVAMVRLWLAMRIMWFASLVAGCEYEVTTDFKR